LLLHQGAITVGDLRQALGSRHTTERPLGAELLHMGLADPSALRVAVAEYRDAVAALIAHLETISVDVDAVARAWSSKNVRERWSLAAPSGSARRQARHSRARHHTRSIGSGVERA
jgi:hypothetical protein